MDGYGMSAPQQKYLVDSLVGIPDESSPPNYRCFMGDRKVFVSEALAQDDLLKFFRQAILTRHHLHQEVDAKLSMVEELSPDELEYLASLVGMYAHIEPYDEWEELARSRHNSWIEPIPTPKLRCNDIID